jgi:parallel beta-helix repeat protein
MRTCAVVVLTLVVAAPLHAATLTVDDDGPADYNNIRAAVAVAGEGDTVEVHPGMYQELVELHKSVNLVGVDLPSIVGPPPSPVKGRTKGILWGISIYASVCLVDGFRIERGAGLEVRASDGTIRNNFFDGYTIELASCSRNTLCNNHASRGGIHLSSGSNNTLCDNVITDSGAGIYLSGGSANTLRNNEISGCNTGLGISSSLQNVLRGNRLHDNTINFDLDVGPTVDPNGYNQDIDTSNTVDGRPIYYLVNQSDVIVDAASNAGCIVAVNCSRLAISDMVLSRNRDGLLFVNTRDSRVERVTTNWNERCGIYLHDSPGNSLLGNTATDATFGIYLEYSGDCTLRNNTMASNTYNFGCGGAPRTDYRQDIDTSNLVDGKPVYYLVGQKGTVLDGTVQAGCVFAVGCTDITVRDQTLASNDRGLVLVDCQSPTLENVAAMDNNWAGIVLQSCTQALVSRCSACRNYEGMGLSDNGGARLVNNTLVRNYRGLSAIESDLTLNNCYVHGNAERGGIIFEGVQATVLNCTICNNVYGWWTTDAGGIAADDASSVTIANTIIWGNHPAQLSQEEVFTTTFCDIQGGFAGPGNLDEPPRLTSDGHLCLGSPCIDAGRAGGGEYPTSDRDGENRVQGQSVDIGADEYIDGDKDGLPDWWELKYFGSETAADAAGDPDGDAYTNVTEYELYSTDPTIPAVTYYVDATRPDDSGDGLSWETARRTIQSAIDQAADSDRVRIAPGIYDEWINTRGSQILIAGLDANDPNTIAQTVITQRLTVGSNEGPGCVVAGLTITGDVEAGLDCSNASPTIRNCMFTGAGHWNSGGIRIENAAPTFSHCTISGICGDWWEAGIYCRASTPVFRNCIVAGNIAQRPYEGQTYALRIEQSDVLIDRCTIANNGDPYEVSSQDSAICCVGSRLRVMNSILWNDLPQQIKSSESTIFVAYSDVRDGNEPVEGLVRGLGNITIDPCFVALGGWDARPGPGDDAHWIQGDYHLRSTGWQDDLSFSPGARDVHVSRCIDAGNPAEALGNEPVVAPGAPSPSQGVNLRVDLGAYGGTAEASPAPAGWALLTDFNNDGIVNLLDFHHFSRAFRTQAATVADVDRNARVDYAELALLANDWLYVTDWSDWKAYRPRQ